MRKNTQGKEIVTALAEAPAAFEDLDIGGFDAGVVN
jgi:hypothetical protein